MQPLTVPVISLSICSRCCVFSHVPKDGRPSSPSPPLPPLPLPVPAFRKARRSLSFLAGGDLPFFLGGVLIVALRLRSQAMWREAETLPFVSLGKVWLGKNGRTRIVSTANVVRPVLPNAKITEEEGRVRLSVSSIRTSERKGVVFVRRIAAKRSGRSGWHLVCVPCARGLPLSREGLVCVHDAGHKTTPDTDLTQTPFRANGSYTFSLGR